MKDLIDGLLLGDGSMCKRAKNARYRHSCKHIEYLKFVITALQKYGVEIPTIYDKDNGYGTGRIFQIQSRVSVQLTEHYSRWYSEKKKVVPEDVSLTPLTILHWYIGDGWLDTDKGYLRQIGLATHSFSPLEREVLCSKLIELGLKAANRPDGRINICKSSVFDFLEYIGECPVECYKYKFDVLKYNKPQPRYKV